MSTVTAEASGTNISPGSSAQGAFRAQASGTKQPDLCGDLDEGAGSTGWYQELLIGTLFRTSIKLQSYIDRRFQPFAMTAQEASVLLTCVDARRITPGGLAHILGRDKSKVTRFLQRLVARNLMRRKPKVQDRRFSELEPTSQGRAIASRLRLVFDEIRDDLFQGIPGKEVERVGDILTALIENIQIHGATEKTMDPRIKGGAVKLRGTATRDRSEV